MSLQRLVLLIKSLMAFFLVYSGLFRLLHKLRRPTILVLAYHRVTKDDDLDQCAYPAMHVSVSSFERQLRAVRDLYRIVPMSELHEIMQGKRPLREHVAVITFDDGYEDNFKNAFPLLARHDFPATFFLSLGFVDAKQPFWFDELADCALAWESRISERDSLRQQIPPQLVDALDAPHTHADRLTAASSYLKQLKDTERRVVLQKLRWGLTSETPIHTAEPMLWDDMKRMLEGGMNFGAHSVSHGILTRMEPDRARLEIQASLDGISRRLGHEVREFAYPNGDTNESVSRFARESGAELAFTMQPKANRPGDPLQELGRFNICEATSRSFFSDFSRSYFWCEISGFFHVLLRRGSRGGGAVA